MQLRTTITESSQIRARRRNEHDELTNSLLSAAAGKAGAERQRIVDEVIVLNLGLAEAIARRYRGRGIDNDDLMQVANLGLVHAAQRFDPGRGRDFVSFAVPTILGEVKRYFRDHGWSVRPPRRVQELNSVISGATTEVAQRLGALPSAVDMAAHLGLEPSEVLEARSSSKSFRAASMEDRGVDGEGTPLVEWLGTDEAGFGRVEAVAALAPAIRTLESRDRAILFMRYFRGWTQQEIGDELGITQMQVSRMLTRILRRLRTAIGELEQSEGDADL